MEGGARAVNMRENSETLEMFFNIYVPNTRSVLLWGQP